MLLLIPLLLLLPYNITAQQCLKLTDSKACPAFTSYYISLNSTATLQQPSWLNGVNDVAGFDNAIMAHLISTSYSQSFWQSQLGCQSLEAANRAPYAQYSVSVACAQLILDPTLSLPCNLQYNILPNALCASSCQQYANSVASILNDSRICNKQSSNASTESVQQMCSSDNADSGTYANSCIDASLNERDNCGEFFFNLISFFHIDR
jgi:hypothetical protein